MKTDITSLEQNSKEWLEARKRYLGASEAPIIAGLSKYKTIFQLFDEKTGLVEAQPSGFAASRGHELEPVARDMYNFEFVAQMEPKNFVHANGFMSASLDGWDEALGYGIEIKCPMSHSIIENASLGKITPDYYAQVQHQMICSGSTFTHVVVYDGKDKIHVILVNENKSYQRNLKRLSAWFWHKVQNKKAFDKYGVRLEPPVGLCMEPLKKSRKK